MLHGGSGMRVSSLTSFLLFQHIAIFSHFPWSASVVVPSSYCYVLDNSSHLVDFTDWVGHPFEYEGTGGKDVDLVVRFCKDVETRSQTGYVDFGRYSSFNYFVVGSGPVSFVQGFYNGDLANCEQSFDKMGRNAQVNIVCGKCLNGACKGDLGCICNVAYDITMCRVFVELAIPCVKHGSRVFKGFTVGFHPRSWEVVYNGLTQRGFEKVHHKFRFSGGISVRMRCDMYSFGTEQTHVSLYLTAISVLSDRVGKPVFKVNPDKGLEVKLSGSGANGSPPTTLSPSVMIVNWRCETAHDTPYEVLISIPVKDYDPVEFTLTKICGYRQDREGDNIRGWATFGVVSCILVVLSVTFCCGGFVYRSRVDHQRGIDALPGINILSACLEAVSGPRGYTQADDANGAFINKASWERASVSSQGTASESSQGTQRTSERRYGSI